MYPPLTRSVTQQDFSQPGRGRVPELLRIAPCSSPTATAFLQGFPARNRYTRARHLKEAAGGKFESDPDPV
jgi:hypothetical protein